MIRHLFFLSSVFCFLSSVFCFSPYAFCLPSHEDAFSFSNNDRILIVAPHPDDETIGTGGVIQRAVKAGAEVKIIYLTRGESNEISSLFYHKKPMILKTDFVKIARLRKGEAVQAMSVLGVPEKNLYFFGYPDMGTMPIWERHWEGIKPFRSFFTRLNKVIHADDYSYGKYFHGYNIVRDFKKVILDFGPTHIFCTPPFDRNLDHQAAYLFLNAALLDARQQVETLKPRVHLYLVHAHDWPKPKKYLPAEDLSSPPLGGVAGLVWRKHDLGPDEVYLKSKALSRYKSQLSYSKNFLFSFVRKNEIFADYPFELIKRGPVITPDAWVSAREGKGEGDVSYTVSGGELLIEIPLLFAIDEMGTLSGRVFGYKKESSFTQMPKISFKLLGNRLYVKNKSKNFYDSGILFKTEKSRLFIRVPLKSLKDPDYLFVSTRSAKNRLSLDFGAWRVIQISKNAAG